MLDRAITNWKKLPEGIRFGMMVVTITACALFLLWLIAPKTMREREADDCEAFGEMMKLNTKAIGYTCYVEVTPNRWIDRDVFEATQSRDFRLGFGD